ncbi:MAG TPA: hypothetical protein VG847_10305 [Chitinophagaceae bacterium]|nr:hypothetical protein [Chitinophagaceae bacterium]
MYRKFLFTGDGISLIIHPRLFLLQKKMRHNFPGDDFPGTQELLFLNRIPTHRTTGRQRL